MRPKNLKSVEMKIKNANVRHTSTINNISKSHQQKLQSRSGMARLWHVYNE